MRSVLAILAILSVTVTQAFTLGGAGAAAVVQPARGLATPLTEAPGLRVAPGAVTMRRRTNLKKEKRARNRVNAFRFKKGGTFKFTPRGPRRDDAGANEDAAFYAQVFTQSALAAEAEKAEE